ncbi:MAG TPA: hypothetical protein DEG90_07940 [Porphyromonadaceae bacterium]|nr:hypothetical protein [Porphyromonadaceae bacterium]
MQQQIDRQKKQEESIVRGHQETKDLIQRFFPEVISALPAIRDCIKVKMFDNLITMLLDGKPKSFKSGATLYDPDADKDVDVGNVEVQIKQDPADDNNYRLHLVARESSNGSKKVAISETDSQEQFQNKMIEREPQANHLWLPFPHLTLKIRMRCQCLNPTTSPPSPIVAYKIN